MELQLTKENFQEFVLDSAEPVMVDFHADWCGPCKMLSKVLSELADTHCVGKVNVEQEPELASEYGAMVIPMVLLFKNGHCIAKAIGYQTKEELEKMFIHAAGGAAKE